MYWKEIAWLLSWPLLIWVNYLLIRFALRLYEKKFPNLGEQNGLELKEERGNVKSW